jgi:hypothetical protein
LDATYQTKRATKRASGRKAKKKQTELRGSYPSIGDKKHIFGMAINENEIDPSAGPPDMRTRDPGELFDSAVDVTSLPGMFSHKSTGNDESYDEAQRTTAMAALLLSTAVGKKAQLHDSLWKTPKRHAPGQIKGSVTLFKFVKAIGKAEAPAFNVRKMGCNSSSLLKDTTIQQWMSTSNMASYPGSPMPPSGSTQLSYPLFVSWPLTTRTSHGTKAQPRPCWHFTWTVSSRSAPTP